MQDIVGLWATPREDYVSFSYKAIQPISSYPTEEHNKGGFCEGKRFAHLQCVDIAGTPRGRETGLPTLALFR